MSVSSLSLLLTYSTNLLFVCFLNLFAAYLTVGLLQAAYKNKKKENERSLNGTEIK